MKKIIFTILISLFVSSESYATKPAQWLENDWVKFIDTTVWGTLSDGYAAVGGKFPLVDVYSALSASGSAVKPGLQRWLRIKIANAYAEEKFTQGDRYNAFYSCLTWNACDELRKLERELATPKNWDDLIGSWVGCDGRMVTFTLENGEYIGRYTKLGGLEPYHFKVNEIGYKAKRNLEGKYVGQVKWRWTSGKKRWSPNTITINGNKYTDSGSDSCSRKMDRR